MTDEEYSTTLQQFSDEVTKILNSDWENIHLPLIKKAAKFLIRETIIKHDLTNSAPMFFQNIEDCMQFYAELCKPANSSVQYSNLDIGKYCTTLFLVYDRCNGQHLYDEIMTQVTIITDSRFSIDKTPPSFEDYLKEGDVPAQNTRADFIYRLKKHFNCLVEYLISEGLLKKDSPQRKFGFYSKSANS